MKTDQTRRGVADIAARAGVGTATVDRVLNERGGVSQKTIEKVLHAAREIGVRRILPSSHQRIIRIEAILPRPELPLIARMINEFRHVLARAQNFGRPVIIQRRVLKDEAPLTIAHALRETRCDAVIVYSQEHELVDDAIHDLHLKGIPVVTLISDLSTSQRLAYAGTDHVRAGSTAGYFMSSIVHRPGPLIVLCNHLGFQSHAKRVEGFREALKLYAPSLEITEVVEGHDDRILSKKKLAAAFKAHPDTVGVYNVGAANLAVIAAIHQHILHRKPVFIGHELTENTRLMLKEGDMAVAIDQNPEQQVQFALSVLMHHFGFEGMAYITLPYVSPVPFTLYGPTNT